MDILLDPVLKHLYGWELKRKSGIYCIHNRINGKNYIGSTNNLWKRFKDGHRCSLRAGRHHNSYLQNAFNKYGEDAFEYQVLEYCQIEQLDDRENWWLSNTKSAEREYGYNLDKTAQHAKMSEETKYKISIANKGKKSHNKGKSGPLKGIKKGPMSEETKRRLSIAKKGKPLLKNRGKKHPPEAIERMRQARLGKKLSEEHKKKIKESTLKFFSSDAGSKAKVIMSDFSSKRMKQRWENNKEGMLAIFQHARKSRA